MNALIGRLAPQLRSAALLAIALLGLALSVQTARLGSARRALALEQALHQTDIANMRAAQAVANADWQAETARIRATNGRLKDETDRAADAVRTQYLDRVLHLPDATADPGAATNAALSGTDAAEGADRSSRDAILLARSDALICATNTARLEAAHDWAMQIAAEP
jgi:hypothetical protein